MRNMFGTVCEQTVCVWDSFQRAHLFSRSSAFPIIWRTFFLHKLFNFIMILFLKRFFAGCTRHSLSSDWVFCIHFVFYTRIRKNKQIFGALLVAFGNFFATFRMRLRFRFGRWALWWFISIFRIFDACLNIFHWLCIFSFN